MDWRVKGVVQGGIARLPASDRVNYVFQRYVTRTVVLRQDWLAGKLEQAAAHWANWQRGSGDEQRANAPGRVLELGTGWHPVVALALALAGAGEVVSVDRVALLRANRLPATAGMLLAEVDAGRWPAPLPTPDPARLARLRTMAAAAAVAPAQLREVGVCPLIRDAQSTGLAAGSVELFVSNNTFEHIPRDVLASILAHDRWLAGPAAVASHFVDMSDHYSHFDDSISRVHFLRYSERGWRKWNNAIVPQNRLRSSDYRSLLERAGFRVVAERRTDISADELAAVPLDSAFLGYPAEELLAVAVWLSAVAATGVAPAAGG